MNKIQKIKNRIEAVTLLILTIISVPVFLGAVVDGRQFPTYVGVIFFIGAITADIYQKMQEV